MNKRKLLTLAMTLCMVAILAIGGTLAYFQDDEQANNTMVLGNVQINIDEVTYMDEDGDGDPDWDTFEDDEFVLYPQAAVDGRTNYNKMVYTANTSSSKDAAYIRNIVLFEANSLLTDVDDNEGDCCFPGMHYFYNNAARQVGYNGQYHTGSSTYSLTETVHINGTNYWVAVFEAMDEKPIAYDEALYSLSSVCIDKNVTSEQIAGWGADNKVDIIVFSQGIQSTDLSHEEAMAALGEVNQANLTTWISSNDDAFLNDWTDKPEYADKVEDPTNR